MTRKLFYPLLTLAFAMLACQIQATPATPTAPIQVVPSDTPIPVAPTDTPVPPTPASLTRDMLRNGTYFAPVYGKTITLADGAYSEGSGADAYSVQMLDLVAFGDLNGDGSQDAAILLAENGGGSGVFVSLVAVLDSGGVPVQAGQVQLGDRVVVNSATITSGTVSLDLLVQGPNDPMCCPSQSETQSYQMIGGALWLSRLVSFTPDNQARSITINDPAWGTSVSNPFIVSGSVTISPFENTLAYRLYLPDGTKVNEGSLMVDSGGNMGSPGTFSQSFDLSNAGISGPLIVQFLDLSAADGSTIGLGSVLVNIQ